MDPVLAELAALRRRMRVQTVAFFGVLAVCCTAMGGADALARTAVAVLTESDAWTVSTNNASSTLTPRIVVTSGENLCRVKFPNGHVELHATSTAPTSPAAGALWFDSGTNKFRYFNGTSWNEPGLDVPVAAVMAWTTTTAPGGWLLCDGQAVSRTTYSALFAVIGTTYGTGDGSTTFNLPNLKGRVPVGRDSGQSEFDNLAETGGAKTHTLTVNEMPSHTHDVQTYNAGSGMGATKVSKCTTGTGATTVSGAALATGGGQPHNNLQPYLVLNFIIKAQ